MMRSRSSKSTRKSKRRAQDLASDDFRSKQRNGVHESSPQHRIQEFGVSPVNKPKKRRKREREIKAKDVNDMSQAFDEESKRSNSMSYAKVFNFKALFKPALHTTTEADRLEKENTEEQGKFSNIHLEADNTFSTYYQPQFPRSEYDYEEFEPSRKALEAARKVRSLIKANKGQENECSSTKECTESINGNVESNKHFSKNRSSVESCVYESADSKTIEEEADFLLLSKSKTQFQRVLSNMVNASSEQFGPSDRPPWLEFHDANRDAIPSDATLWLHNEILEFVNFIDATDFEKPLRSEAIRKTRELVKSIWPHSITTVFGSVPNNLCIPGSDVDLVIHNVPEDAIHHLSEFLRVKQITDYLEVITKARIPIIKLRLKGSTIMVDVSFGIDGGLKSGEIIRDLLKQIPNLRPLTIVIKYFLMQRGLNETYSGGLGSHSCLLTVISMLQHVRRRLLAEQRRGRLQKGVMLSSYEDLGCLLLEFFDLYGNKFNYALVQADLLHGGEYRFKYPCETDGKGGIFSLLNPEDPTHDIGKSTFAIARVRRVFAYAFRVLSLRLSQFNPAKSGNLPNSILESVIFPDARLVSRRESVYDLDVSME